MNGKPMFGLGMLLRRNFRKRIIEIIAKRKIETIVLFGEDRVVSARVLYVNCNIMARWSDDGTERYFGLRLFGAPN